MDHVYATGGGHRFHATADCRDLRNGQELYGGWGTLRTHRIDEMTIVTAFGCGKEPCATCYPELRAALYRGNCEDDFGHEPFLWPGLPDAANGYACARCWTGEPVAWPCTSAIVLGLAPRGVTA
ncbi:hypothetical protein [Streptomyces mirabilis]|uniref:hypothetical protein n=1 Tax=Streptomyces mirabilis TaxID=68239 RepID=UPI0033C1D411